MKHLSFAIGLLAASMCFAQTGGYVSLYGGKVVSQELDSVNIKDDDAVSIDFDDGDYGGIAIGRRDDVGRMEFDVSVRSMDLDSIQTFSAGGTETSILDGVGDFEAISVMGNFYLFLVDGNDPIRPYVGFGFGVSALEVKVLGTSERDTVFAWQAMAGVELDIIQHMTTWIGYRIWGTTEPEFAGTEFDGLLHHGLEAGIRIEF